MRLRLWPRFSVLIKANKTETEVFLTHALGCVNMHALPPQDIILVIWNV